MQKSICAGFNKFSAAIYLPPCFPEAFFYLPIPGPVKLFSAPSQWLLLPNFKSIFPTKCSHRLLRGDSTISACLQCFQYCTNAQMHTAHCTTANCTNAHCRAPWHARKCCRSVLILVLHCTVVLIISVLVVWVMAEQLNFPKNIARQSSSLSPNNSLVIYISSSPWAGSYK